MADPVVLRKEKGQEMLKLHHWKILISLVAILLLALTVNFGLFRYIPIKFVAAVASTPELPYLKYPNESGSCGSDSWFIVNDKALYQNWINKGLNLPPCDFSKNFLIVSPYRITAVFYSPFINDECLGAPRGVAFCDKDKSKAGLAYIYLMPRIWLTQGIG